MGDAEKLRKMNSTKILVSGVGLRMRTVLQRTLEHLQDYEIVGVFDPYQPNVDKFQQEIGKKVPIASTFEDLLQREADWVFIGSPNNQHPPQVLASVEKKLNIFCEKPLAPRYQDLVELYQALDGYSRHFFFGLVLRYSPFYQELKKIMESGRIGEVLSFEFNELLGPSHGGYIMGNWRRNSEIAGTHMLEKCCHDIDIANWLMESLPIRTASFGGRRFFTPEHAQSGKIEDGDRGLYKIYRSWEDPLREDPFTADKDIVDHQVVLLEYRNGVKATFHTNLHCAIPERRFFISGSKGAVRGDVIRGILEVKGIQDEAIEVIDLEYGKGGHGGGDPYMSKQLSALMRGEMNEPAAGIAEAIRASVPCYGIDQALAENRVVDLQELWNPFGSLEAAK